MSQSSDLKRGTDDKPIADQQPQPERYIHTAPLAVRAPVPYPTVRRYSQYQQPPVQSQLPAQPVQPGQPQFNHQQPYPPRRKMMFEGSTLFHLPGYVQSPDPQAYGGVLTPGVYLPSSYFPDEASMLSSVPSDYMDDNMSGSSASSGYWGYINNNSASIHQLPPASMHNPEYTSLPPAPSPATTTNNYLVSLYNTYNTSGNNNGSIPESPINPKQQLPPLHQPYLVQHSESDHHLHQQHPQQQQIYDNSSSSVNSSSLHSSSLSTRSTTSSSNTSSSVIAMASPVNTMGTMPNYLYVGQQYTTRNTTIVDSTTRLSHVSLPALPNPGGSARTASTSSSPRSNESNSPGSGPVHYSSSVYNGNSGLSASNDESSSSASRNDKKKYECHICGKYFKRDLPRHLRTHQEVARFVCPYPRENCPHKRGQFNRPYDFKKHLLHGHFIFDDQKTVRSFRDLKSKLHHQGTCVCGLRFEASQWLDHHVLGGTNPCSYLVRSSFGHDSKDMNMSSDNMN